jgi:HD-GYP domain-containing protein (c-di-GMP phosphodiesterase class II)
MAVQIHHEGAGDIATVREGLRERLRDLGVALIACNDQGMLISASLPEADWLVDLLTGSAVFRNHLQNAVRTWASAQPTVVQPMPGLWLAPTPIVTRRRRVGYSVAVIITPELLINGSGEVPESLATLCQSSGADARVISGLIAQLPPIAPSEVHRVAAMVRHAHEDHQRLSSDTQAIESVGKQLAESYEELNLLYTIITSMTVQQRPERFVAIACQELLATLPYKWIGTQFAEDRARLKTLAGRLIIAGEPGRVGSELRDVARGVVAQAEPGVPMVFDPLLNPRHAHLATLGNTVLIQPVSSAGEVVGLLIAGDKQGPDTAASSADMKLLGATATHMAIFLENAALYDDLNDMFLGTLEALTASIDAKDRYTCGHSRRVAHLTRQLARAVGLDEPAVERMHIAGLVHDVGKIGVPETVLLKPGKLTEEEYAWIRQHPEIGYRILKDIPQLNDILPGVLYHHERWDGRGYPEGLSGEAIPLVARLIGLADSFDAMSSTRTYRSAMSRSQVLAEITRCIGTQFDPQLARVFVNLDFSEFDQLVNEHRARETDFQEKAA